jgi:Bacterial capsule synthesis protein PGA_cap
MTSAPLTLWTSTQPAPIAARVAIAGDFLPTGSLSLPEGGWSEAARRVQSALEDVSVSFLNLECPLDSENLPFRPLNGIGQIVSADSGSLDYLQSIRSLAVGLANNHSYDFGNAGVARTHAALLQKHFVALGAGRTLHDVPETFVWQGPGNVRVGFWAAAHASRDLATRRSEGVEPATVARARLAMAALKSQGAKCAMALLHAGCLRTNRPDPHDAALMDAIVSSGFDIVAASHSHRISGSKLLPAHGDTPAFCFYGLGSIVSGYIASPLERECLLIVAGFHSDGSLASVEVRPIWLSESGFAEIPSPESSDTILNRFLSLSAEIADGSSARRFYEDMSRGLVPLYARDLRAAFRQSGLLGLARKATRIRTRHLRRLLHGVIS